jgi:hypothetical protein
MGSVKKLFVFDVFPQPNLRLETQVFKIINL